MRTNNGLEITGCLMVCKDGIVYLVLFPVGWQWCLPLDGFDFFVSLSHLVHETTMMMILVTSLTTLSLVAVFLLRFFKYLFTYALA